MGDAMETWGDPTGAKTRQDSRLLTWQFSSLGHFLMEVPNTIAILEIQSTFLSTIDFSIKMIQVDGGNKIKLLKANYH